MGRGKGKAVVNIICFLQSQSQGRLTKSFLFFRLRMIQRSPGRSLFLFV